MYIPYPLGASPGDVAPVSPLGPLNDGEGEGILYRAFKPPLEPGGVPYSPVDGRRKGVYAVLIVGPAIPPA